MNPERDWESQLRGLEYDLPKERWARLEVDLLRRIREPEAVPGRMQRIAAWWKRTSVWLRPAPVAAGFACLFLAMGWWFLRSHGNVPVVAQLKTLDSWAAGTVLHSDTLEPMAWTAARCTVSLKGDVRRLESPVGARLRLENGSVRFGVQPRHAGEPFVVEFGDCRATVVGTAFSLQVDSSGARASVEHGKVRIDGGRGLLGFLTQGQSMVCRETAGSAGLPAKRDSAIKPSPASGALAAPLSARDDSEWEALWNGCKTPSDRCLEDLSTYLRRHPTGEKAAKAASLWAERAKARGDFRDALYALDLAAHAGAGELSFQARLDACVLKARELHQETQAIKDVDALLGSLPEGARKVRAAQLRAQLGGLEKGTPSGAPDLP